MFFLRPFLDLLHKRREKSYVFFLSKTKYVSLYFYKSYLFLVPSVKVKAKEQ